MRSPLPLAPIALAALLLLPPGYAATPEELQLSYQTEASGQDPTFKPSIQRGQAFYQRTFTHSAPLPSCASCHTDNPQQNGRHKVTGKIIKPLSPLANRDRFSDSAKVEKWFYRNCTEVVGRSCSAAEKADFIAFLIGGDQ